MGEQSPGMAEVKAWRALDFVVYVVVILLRMFVRSCLVSTLFIPRNAVTRLGIPLSPRISRITKSLIGEQLVASGPQPWDYKRNVGTCRSVF